jgi:hypothetical protein
LSALLGHLRRGARFKHHVFRNSSDSHAL